MDALLETFRHKTWATLTLLEYCARLDPLELDATSPGTFGSIRKTLHHLVASEEGYCARVTGQQPSEPLGDGPAALDDLAARMRALGPRWEGVVADPSIAGGEFRTSDGWLVAGVVPMIQAIHHAAEHRGHVLSTVGARGLPVPDLSMWAYSQSRGLMRIDPAPRYVATVRTARGNFEITVAEVAAAPEAVNRFLFLAMDEFYDGLAFHRVVVREVVQAGDGMKDGTVGPALDSIEIENPSWSRGSVGLASSGGPENASQFFITLRDGTVRQGGESYWRIGEVTGGLAVVEAIQEGDALRSIEIAVL